MRPYSIAVVPVSSRRKRFSIKWLLCLDQNGKRASGKKVLPSGCFVVDNRLSGPLLKCWADQRRRRSGRSRGLGFLAPAGPARQIRLPRHCGNHAPAYSDSAMTDRFGIMALSDASSIIKISPAIMTQDVA